MLFPVNAALIAEYSNEPACWYNIIKPNNINNAPPTVIKNALSARITYHGCRKKPISRQLVMAVISQKMYNKMRFAEKISPIIAPKKRTTIE